MNMNWRKKKVPIQKTGFCGDLLNLINYVAEEIVVEEQGTGSGTGSGTGAGAGAGAGTGLIGGENNGAGTGAGTGAGAGLIGDPNTALAITINDIKIPFTQKTDSNSNFIHIMESNIENNNYQARFGILTQVPSLNNSTDYSLILYDNNRNVIVHADKISVPTIPQQKQYGYQITVTQNNSNTFNVYQTETCTITISDKKSSS